MLLEKELKLYCTCSEERAERAVALLQSPGQPDDEGPHTVRCEFCGVTYKVG